MELTIKFRNTNSRGQEYKSSRILRVDSREEFDEVMDLAENKGKSDPRYAENEEAEPEDFGYAGGFCTEVISCTDASGKDFRAWLDGWW